MRLFLGITFENTVTDKITPILDQLTDESVAGRATASENIHLTLIFLGDIDPANLDSLKKAIQIEACAFDLWIRDVGFFHSVRQGSTFYLGVEAVPDLLSLEAKLRESLISHGFNVDKRSYHPHVTIGRKMVLKDQGSLDRLKEDAPSLRFWVDSFQLVESTTSAQKPLYQTITSIKLSECE